MQSKTNIGCHRSNGRSGHFENRFDGDREAIKRLTRAVRGVKQRIHNPKLPNDACYAGVAYELPASPIEAARLLYDELGPMPPSYSLDRIDPNGNYALSNLRYATPKEQTANRRPMRKRSEYMENEWGE